MRNKVILLPVPDPSAAPVQLFAQYNRLNLQKEAHRHQMDKALAIYTSLCQFIRPRAVVSAWDEIELSETKLHVGGCVLTCPAFSMLKAGRLRHVYTYFLTVGTPLYNNTSPLNRLYADSWYTLLVDESRNKLEQILRERSGSIPLSPSYGPGFYGMHVKEMLNLAALSDPSLINVRITEHMLLLPEKTCAGLYIAADTPACFPKTACLSCAGNRMNCSYCRLRNQAGG